VETGRGTAVTSHQREKFERDGYLIVENPVPESVIDEAMEDVEGRFLPVGSKQPTRGDDGVLYYPNRIMDAWRISDSVKAIALEPTIIGILKELYGRRPLPFQTLNFLRGTQQTVHSDTIHFNSMPAGYMCGVWVAFEDVDMDCGPLVYYPGSHKLSEVTMQAIGAEADMSDYSKYEDHISSLIEEHGLEPEYATISKGEALIWSANLLHGGAPVRDESRTRKSQVTHFFFEGCRYYTPLLSKDLDKGEEISWRDPVWLE
jgi:phytanoyl-CoA dioxygenase PhyH